MKALTLILLLCSALFFIGCSKTEENANTGNANNSNAKPAATTKAAEPASTASTGAATNIGVAECDEYFAKMDKCMENPNVPEAVKASYRSSMETSRKAWKNASMTPEGKASLATTCKTALDSAKSFFATCK
ncbi:MAG: hypothetical protein JO360_14055 [Acidobacteria bacterium]|nr:hypothetical protein [Acidobacteriota bacterium]